jgi:beta-mannosidase
VNKVPAILGGFELARTGREVSTPDAPELAALSWTPALVPGGVHESLLAAGLIEHPYFGRNEHDVRWIEDETWWYRTTFAAPARAAGERVQLTFPGLDTVVSIWLNGELLGEHASQFRPATFDVTSLLRDDNKLVLRFSPPLQDLTAPASVTNTVDQMRALMGLLMPDKDDSTEKPPGVISANLALTLRRKGTFSWGWDCAPRLPSVGILRPVELSVEAGAALSGHHIATTAVDVEARTATVRVDVEADVFAHSGPLTAHVRLTAPGGEHTEYTVGLLGGAGAATVKIENAQLWWTHDLGDPACYEVHIELRAEDGTVLDQVDDRIGLRTVTLDRRTDVAEGGRLFRFVLNGVPVFARGANWLPADMMVGSVTAGHCRALVGKAREANMTMLRVWAGGIYEQDAFYDACDSAGILVWQDFMFACIDYPSEDPALRAEVVAEARHQVRRLRNHPSLAVWCGNNEVHGIHDMIYHDLGPGDWGYAFFHEILPDAVAGHSPETIYWPGSPWADSANINGVLDGDRHAWEVWHGVDLGAGGPAEFASHGEAVHFHRYAHDHGKFISEFGIHAAPELSTLERWTEPGTLSLHSPEFDHRNKDVPKDKGDDMMSIETGLPRDLREYVDFSMVTQAEGLKFGIEHFRRRQPHTSGTLLWQLNDPWPGLSWSIVDYDLVPKAGYYFVQRAYRPVVASFTRTGDGTLQLWVTNSGTTTARLSLRVEVATFEGKQVIDEQIEVEVAGLTSEPVWSADSASVGAGADRFAWVSDEAGAIEPNRLFFAPIKDLEFGTGHLESEVTPGPEGTATVELISHGYNYLTRVTAPIPGVTFSSNYLDLRDGDSKRIIISGLPAGFDLGSLSIGIYAGQN